MTPLALAARTSPDGKRWACYCAACAELRKIDDLPGEPRPPRRRKAGP